MSRGRGRFCEKPTSPTDAVHSTHARRLHPRLHGKPFTLATPSSSSRSSRKLRGTSPFIALSPARRRRVSGARRRRVFFHDASSSRVDVVVTKRRHRACDEEFCACTHADVRARHLVIAELSLPPRRSISSIVAFSGATRLATRLIFLVTRFRANERRSRDAFPPVSARASGPTQPRDPSRRGIASRRRSTRARPPVGPGSSRARPCSSPRRRSIVATRDPTIQQLHSQKRAGNIRSQISHWANRPSKQRFGFVFFFVFSFRVAGRTRATH